jgi:hypothetical protein
LLLSCSLFLCSPALCGRAIVAFRLHLLSASRTCMQILVWANHVQSLQGHRIMKSEVRLDLGPHLWPSCGILVHSPSPVIAARQHRASGLSFAHITSLIASSSSSIHHNTASAQHRPSTELHTATHTSTSFRTLHQQQVCLTTTTPPLLMAPLPSSPNASSSSSVGPCSR